jgi:predicted small metal-binding protein
MAYDVRCADTGADCPGHFTTPTKEEMMKHLEVHVEAAHPGLELTEDQVNQLIKVK